MLNVKRRWIIIVELLLLVGVVTWICVSLKSDVGEKPANAISLKAPIHGESDLVYLYRLTDGSYRYRITSLDNAPVDFTPEAFAQRIYTEHNARTLLSVLLNITSPWGIFWVSLGLLGQILFTGKMVVQWLVSEKQHQSVVPPAFWWMSLIGATMLLVYFIWRRDAVGVLGQSVGWFIYLRNLWLIYGKTPGMLEASASDSSAIMPASTTLE